MRKAQRQRDYKGLTICRIGDPEGRNKENEEE